MPKNGKSTCAPPSRHLSNTTPKRRGIANMLLGQFRETPELHDVDIIGGDINMSAYCERGKSKLSSFEETREMTLMTPHADLVAMWDSVVASKKETCHKLRGVMHGSLQLNTEKLQIMRYEQGAAHLPVFMHLCEIPPWNVVHATRLPRNTERSEGRIASRGRKVKRQARAPWYCHGFAINCCGAGRIGGQG